MRMILLCALALTLGACAQAPYTPAPTIAPLNFGPVKAGNKAISEGNKKIGQGVQTVQTKLEDTRAKLDAAIVSAHQDKIDMAQLDANLKSASDSLNAAITENTNLRMTTYTQQQTIDSQDQTIETLSKDGEAKQKLIDKQTTDLNNALQAKANAEAALKKLEDQVNAWWGIGAYWYGTKRLGWHILIVLVILAIASFLLNMFVPALSPIFAAIVKFFVGLPGRLGRFIIGLFKRKPPA